jgi:hypothetical protein
MKSRTGTLRTAILIGLLCVFALGRVAYATQQCYRLTSGGCGESMEQVAETQHGATHMVVKVCAQEMEAPDDRGSGTPSTHPGDAFAPLLSLDFVKAPAFPVGPVLDITPPSVSVTLLTSFGRLLL